MLTFDVVPVAAAVTKGGEQGRKEIDTYPALLSAFDFLLIVVGAIDINGEDSAVSQNAAPNDTRHGR
jgi:hypothetical protein